MNYYFLPFAIQLILLSDSNVGAVQKKCYGPLGCLEHTDEWYDLRYRPMTLLPSERQSINTLFYLYHRARTTDAPQVFLNKTQLLAQGFDPEKPIKFVTHGYLDQGLSFWMVQLPEELLKAGDFNVFAVDWGGGSHALYTQASANTRLVGLEIAHFVHFLKEEFGVNASNVHCIGHSLGSHVCAYAGDKIEGLGRITGLDPADPLFQYMPPIVRLSPDDASFVDIIHTDGQSILLLGLGFIEPCGHVDFYPNDGKSQPGCEVMTKPMTVMHTGGMDAAGREMFACDHHRAIFYFMETLTSKCRFMGHRCKDYATYLRGECHSCGEDGSDCALMGLEADQYKIGDRSLLSFYLSTGNAAPFCVYHYRVVVTLAHSQKSSNWEPGRLSIKIIGSLGDSGDVNLTPNGNMRFYHGTTVTFLAPSSKDVGNVLRVKLIWKYEAGYMDVKTTCLFYKCTHKLFVSRVQIMNIDSTLATQPDPTMTSTSTLAPLGSGSTVDLCGESETKVVGIPTGHSLLFKRPC